MASAIESVLKRDRLIVIVALVGIVIPAWAYMVHEARGMNLTGACCLGMKMSGPEMHPWSLMTLPPLFVMWTEMMVAMMIPSAVPMVLTFAAVQRMRREQDRPYVPTGVFVLGYLIVWTVFSAGAALAQWFLHAQALLSPMMASTSRILGGTLLIGAGVFQWTPLKNSCLMHCRTPLSFLMTDWREGRPGAMVMGLKHGAYCMGCCWALMALLFVTGVMNVVWIAILAGLVLAEKILPKGVWFSRGIGLLLVAWGVWVLAGGH